MQLKPLFSSQLPPLPKRALSAHKSSVGSVCVVAGSYGMAGAAYLAGAGALAAGAGYVRIVCPGGIYPILAALVPSAVFIPVNLDDGGCPRDGLQQASDAVETSDVMVIGPGLGESQGAKALFEHLVAGSSRPGVIDASGLSLLAASSSLGGRLQGDWILTPHPGEAARLLGVSPREVQADRHGCAKALAERYHCVAVLKGAGTLVCDASRVFENTSGNAGMAKAGSGDVLAGVIGAFSAQGLDIFEAACLAVYLHGKAGDLAARARGRGLTAQDMLESLPLAICSYEGRCFETGVPD